MKLQKQMSRKVGDKTYDKWVIVLPPNIVKEVGLKEGQELDIKTKDRKIIIS